MSEARTNIPTSAASGSHHSRPSRSPYDAGSSARSTGSAAPASTATIGRQESSTAMAPYAAVQARLVAGRSDHGPRARFWIRSAGEPDQYSPSGTTPNTDEPGATSASLPTSAPGHSMLRAPTRARAPTRTGPRWTTSPSTQKPLRSTSGSIEQPLPSRSIPVTGGMLCRSMSRPTSAPSSRANHVMYGAPASPVAPSSSTTRWAIQSRRCTLPPRGWSPGSTLRRRTRAPAAASSIRPGGVTNTSQPPASNHQDGWGSRVQPRTSASSREPIPTQTNQ